METNETNPTEPVETTVNNTTNPFADKVLDKTLTEEYAPYGYTREGNPKKRPYKQRKSKKRKRSSKPAAKKVEVKIDQTEAPKDPQEPTGGGSTDSDYQQYLKEYQESLDPDARKDSKDEALEIGEPGEAVTAEPVKPKPKYSGSLVIITRFVLPVICTVATRVISRGKKRPTSKDFKLDEFDVEMLRELAEDGAGEEMLGGVNATFIYLILAVSLGANKVMDYWDQDDYVAKMNEFDMMKRQLAEMQTKYEELLKTAEPKEPIEIS